VFQVSKSTAVGTRAASFFQDDGHRLDADLYSAVTTPVLAIAICNGWGGTRGTLVPGIASGLAARLPAVVMAFDYSGWGTSEGRRQRLDPEQEVRDARCAVSWLLQAHPQLEGRIGLFGLSFGGAIATLAAARDDRVAALVAVPTSASGERLMREQREHWRYVEFLEALAADRLERVVSGASRLVDPDWISIRDATSAAFVKQLAQNDASRHFELDLVSAERIHEMSPEREALRLRGRHSLFVAMGRDLRTPAQQCRDVAAIAGDRYVEVPGLGHYDVYAPDRQAWLLDLTAGFYREALLPAA
jgi:pimeloyl-ACP methyl ester carboxylesterase